jgi:hypothetical protein
MNVRIAHGKERRVIPVDIIGTMLLSTATGMVRVPG